jgi:alkane 1-monooxygenase
MTTRTPGLKDALPFWAAVGFVPLLLSGAAFGGWWLVLVPAYGWVVSSLVDGIAGPDSTSLDPLTPDPALHWYRAVTLVWLPVQLALIVVCLTAVGPDSTLTLTEQAGLMVCLGVVTGGVGINFAHELVHRSGRLEAALGEALLISVLYGHFRSEHLLVHHRHVGTPRDPVTARYNESFYRFFPRVLAGCLVSAWSVERDRLARRGLPVWHRSNPFWRYGGGGLACLAVAVALAGPAGAGWYLLQAFVAVWQLEVVNYVEHYGLTRRHLGGGRYEPVRPWHSWNSTHRMTNFLLINLQRHSDHHIRPDRRFPLLQTYPDETAPRLPYGYPLMTAIALHPRLWRRMMNPRVRRWRAQHYPDIRDWSDQGPAGAGAAAGEEAPAR